MMRADRKFIIPCVAALAALLCSQPSFAFTPDEQAFVTAYSDAVNSKSFEKWKALFHPASQACMNGGNKDFFDDAFKKATLVPVAADATISFAPANAALNGVASMYKDLMTLPVQPTHQLQIQSHVMGNDGANHNSYNIVLLVQENGRFYEAGLCPTEKGMAMFHQSGSLLPKEAAAANAAIVNQCTKSMTDVAVKAGVDPQKYIADNQAYLGQCMQYYSDKNNQKTP